MQTSTDVAHLLERMAQLESIVLDAERAKLAIANKLNQLGYKGK